MKNRKPLEVLISNHDLQIDASDAAPSEVKVNAVSAIKSEPSEPTISKSTYVTGRLYIIT